MDQREFTVRYSEALVRRSVGRYFRYLLQSQLGWVVYLLVAALIGYFIYAVVINDRSWFIGALGAVLVLLGMFVVAAYRAQLGHSMARLRSMNEPLAHVTVTEEALTLSSDAGSNTIPWNQFSTILEFSDCWIFALKQRSMFTLPIQGVDGTTLQFMRSKVAKQPSAP